MQNLTKFEKEYLLLMDKHLNENTNKQLVLNILRQYVRAEATKNLTAGRSGYKGDVDWTDDQLK